MITIEPVTAQPGPSAIAAAQVLFGRYAEFLRAIQACHGFDFARFTEEIAALPAPYTERGGELLLAFRHDAGVPASQGVAIGCVAYRAAPPELRLAAGSALLAGDSGDAPACEIKRLFLAPEARGQKLGQLLVREAMNRAAHRGYVRAVLDTEPSSMAPAYRTYLQLGFCEFAPGRVDAGGGPKVIYLERTLP